MKNKIRTNRKQIKKTKFGEKQQKGTMQSFEEDITHGKPNLEFKIKIFPL